VPPEHVPSICGRPLRGRRHVWAFFSRRELHYRALVPYVREGILWGERVLNVIPPGGRDAHAIALREGGVPAGGVEKKGQLVLKDWDETYLEGSRFSADAMRVRVLEAVRATHDEAFGRLRCWGDMSWVRDHPEAADEVLRYERGADEVSRRFPDDVFACAYDASALPGRLVTALAAIHPIVVLDGNVFENTA
jgi:hypothetical protein